MKLKIFLLDSLVIWKQKNFDFGYDFSDIYITISKLIKNLEQIIVISCLNLMSYYNKITNPETSFDIPMIQKSRLL
jgi:hypothetical protein